MNKDGDSDSSDWDSTLDFTSPRQTGPAVFPRIEVEDEDDVSQLDSRADKPKLTSSVPKQDNSKPANYLKTEEEENTQNALYATPQKKQGQKMPPSPRRIAKQQASDSENPPHDFAGAISGYLTPDLTKKQRPGKDRKDNIYDVVDRPTPSASPNLSIGRQENNRQSLQSVGSWDDSDPDERTLRELRQNFSKEKQKEQAAEDTRLKLQAEQERIDEPLATNRSEVSTFKSWASGGGKKNNNGAASSRSKGRKKDKNRPVSAREVKTAISKEQVQSYPRTDDIVVQQQLQPQLQHQKQSAPQQLQDIENRALAHVRAEAKNSFPENLAGTETYNDIPAYIDPPFIVKDEDGRSVYYFGHGSLQYCEVEDDAGEAFMPRIANKVENILRRVYQEFFGLLSIIPSFVILFVVELVKFVIKTILYPIIVGIFGTLGDFAFKPFLSVLFNGFIQPLGVFFWNCFIAFRHMFNPIGDILKKVFVQLAFLCRSIRLVEIHWKTEETRSGKPIEYNPTDLSNV